MQIRPAIRSAIRPALHGIFGHVGYPSGAILHFDASLDPYTEQTGGVHTFNHSVLSPQYQLNADGSYTDVGAKPAVDVFGGQKWLRSCGAVTNLFGGDTSQARSVSLTNGTVYTLQVFGAGTVSCSYGEATVSTPLKITATATASVEFTPTGATYWMLTATAYPVPYVPPGVTQPASNATTTNGSWFTLPDGSPLWQALTGSPLTLATRVRMGVGSADLEAIGGNNVMNNIACNNSTGGLLYNQRYNSVNNVVFSTDGSDWITNGAYNWARSSIVRRFVQVKADGTQWRVGHMIEGTDAVIRWGAFANYDGSFSPSTLYRLLISNGNAFPMWFNKITAWREQVSDARILEAMA